MLNGDSRLKEVNKCNVLINKEIKWEETDV